MTHQLASLGRHAQLTRCFSAVAELLVSDAAALTRDSDFQRMKLIFREIL